MGGGCGENDGETLCSTQVGTKGGISSWENGVYTLHTLHKVMKVIQTLHKCRHSSMES